MRNFFCIFILFFHLFPKIFSLDEWWEKTKVQLLNDNNFYEIVGHNKYVVVKFFTKWCVYCKAMAEEYDKLYEMYKNGRTDVLITKIECSINQKIAADYGIFSFPYIALFFPENKKIKAIFTAKRTAEKMNEWINFVAPKKNLLGIKKEKEELPKNETQHNTTEVSEYITRQFSDIKKKMAEIENFFKNESNLNNFREKNEKEDNIDDSDDNIIEIKIGPFFVLKCIGIFFLFKVVWFNIKNCLGRHTSLPKKIHQKN